MIDYKKILTQVLLENAALGDRAYDLFCKEKQHIGIQDDLIKLVDNKLRQVYNFDYIYLLSENPEKEFFNLFRYQIPLILKEYIEEQKLKEIQDDFQ